MFDRQEIRPLRECTVVHTTNATRSMAPRAHWQPMDKPLHPLTRHAFAVIAENAAAVLEARGMTPGQLGAAAEKAGTISRKTIYNLLNQEKPPNIETLAPLAELLGIPLWALQLPGLKNHKELLAPGALRGLVHVVENYLASKPSRRSDIEETARVAARLSGLDK